jgi:hypothetical protein
VNSAFGAGIDKAPAAEHPPVCYQLNWYAGGALGLQCYDDGKDIIKVEVKTNAKYELTWDDGSVLLVVYPTGKGSTTYWYVEDSNGSVVSGTLK